METAKLVPLFFLLISKTSGYTSTVVHLPQQKSTNAALFDFTGLESKRSPRQHQVTPNIYPSTNYIKSTFPQNEAQPQLFNLGYSVRFDSRQNQQTQPNVQRSSPKMHFVNTKLNQGDIITGTRKQNVQIDIPTNNNPETLPKPQRDIQKRKVVGTKTSLSSQISGNSFNSKTITAQANFSPTTQKYLEVLENVKDVDYQQELSDLYQQKYTWRNLSPNVKIIKSTEVPAPTDNIENRALVFDHAKALAKSEGFGFSDAIRDENDNTNDQTVRENRVNYNEHALPTENFRVTELSEQVSEPLLKTKIVNNKELYSSDQNLNQESDVRKIPQISQVNSQTKTEMIQVIPANLFQTVDGTPLNSKQEIIAQQIPKQIVLQHIKLPQSQFDPHKKFQGKIKYVKQIPSRGNLLHTRKVISNLEYPRKARIKPQLRREIKPPPPEYEINP